MYMASVQCRLKEKGRTFRESFLAKLGLLLRGTVAAPPERFGETLADEHIRGGGCYTYKQIFFVLGCNFDINDLCPNPEPQICGKPYSSGFY